MFAFASIVLSLNIKPDSSITFCVWDDLTQKIMEVLPARALDVQSSYTKEGVLTIQSASTIIAINDERAAHTGLRFKPAAVVDSTQQGHMLRFLDGSMMLLPHDCYYEVQGTKTIEYDVATRTQRRVLPFVIVNLSSNADLFPLFNCGPMAQVQNTDIPLPEEVLQKIKERTNYMKSAVELTSKDYRFTNFGVVNAASLAYSGKVYTTPLELPNVDILYHHKPPASADFTPVSISATKIISRYPMVLKPDCFAACRSLSELVLLKPCVIKDNVFAPSGCEFSLYRASLNIYSCSERVFAELLSHENLQRLEINIVNSECIQQIICPDDMVRGDTLFSCFGMPKVDVSSVEVVLSGDITDRIKGFFEGCASVTIRK